MATFCKESIYLKRESYLGKVVPVWVTFMERKKGAYGEEIVIEVREQGSEVFGETSIFTKSATAKELIKRFGQPEDWKDFPMVITAKKYTKNDGSDGVKLAFGWE